MESESKENYLAAVYRLTRDGKDATTKDIAACLNLSPPSVSEMFGRLARQGYLDHKRRHGVSLTDKGLGVAVQVLRKHRLIETFLVDALGYRLDEVDEEACRLEHAVSDRLADAIEAFLDYPTIDPHGHPIPSRNGSVEERDFESLADMKSGTVVIVSQVNDHDKEKLHYLAGLGVVPGAKVSVAEVAPFEGPLVVEVDGAKVPLARNVARTVGVITEP